MDILELLKGQLAGPVMERLGGMLGLDAAQAQRAGQAILPAQLSAITQKIAAPGGAQQVLDLAAQVPHGTPQELLASPDGLDRIRQSGTALLPQLLGSGLDQSVQQVAAQTGESHGGIQGMMQMVLPLVLGVISGQASKLGLNAGNLGSLFTGGPGGMTGGLGGAAAGIGGAAAGLGAAAAAGLGGVAGKAGDGVSGLGAAVSGLGDGLTRGVGGAAAGIGGAAAGIGGAAAGLGAAAASGLGAATSGLATSGLGDGVATVGQGAGLNGGTVHTNPALGGRRGMGWLWLLPLALLLGLGGCFLLRGKPATPFAVTEPVNGAAVSGPFAVKGTGTAGQDVTVSEKGQAVGKGTVSEDGTYSVDVPAPSAGDHTYALAEGGSSEALNLTVKAAAAAAAAGAGDAMAGMNMNGKFAVTSPAAGVSLPAGAFDLKGSGKPGDVLEIFEDGVSLGKVTVGQDGTWSLNVPSPAAGAHTYTVKGSGGTELGSYATTIAAAAASTAACTKDFSLSISDGQAVAQPFRFGGVGSGKSYTVTVTRDDRKIGSKVLPLDGTCSYSYTSKPGKGKVTYSVAPTGSADVAGKITLTVK